MKAMTTLAAMIVAATTMTATAQTGTVAGGITPDMLQDMQQAYKPTPAERALHNAMNTADINTLAQSADARVNLSDDTFKYRVPSKGITDQKSSGRCWLFTGLNMLRAEAMRKHNLPELEFSQVYNFFYDQLEKSNLFLQTVIETAKKPMDDRRVSWLFRNALSDGGQFTGVSDNLSKYGVVPAQAMPETYISQNTSRFRQLLTWKLCEWGLELRAMAAKGAKPSALEARKAAMMRDVYRMLAQAYGVPPVEFTYNGKVYTPITFYNEMIGRELKGAYVMFMNDPTRPYYKMYEIDLDRHAYDGENWTYLNVPMEDIKQMAIASIKDSTAMYFSCDVGKFLNRKDGTLDLENYDYGAILGTDFGMDKAQRILTGVSGSSHAMTLVGVDVDADGKPVKWLIENSWGNTGHKGHLLATDAWMDQYLFRLVVERKFVPKRLLDMLSQKPVLLPCWDPMY